MRENRIDSRLPVARSLRTSRERGTMREGTITRSIIRRPVADTNRFAGERCPQLGAARGWEKNGTRCDYRTRGAARRLRNGQTPRLKRMQKGTRVAAGRCPGTRRQLLLGGKRRRRKRRGFLRGVRCRARSISRGQRISRRRTTTPASSQFHSDERELHSVFASPAQQLPSPVAAALGCARARPTRSGVLHGPDGRKSVFNVSRKLRDFCCSR